ncbi:MAG: class I SAM-dependent methyltransferase [Endozoicomonadaceae bacterium]|nr:class I SAM-dependent methyltransferase [Endozoicomonadaceae bacterium]
MSECPICISNSIMLFMEGVFDSKSTNVLECLACGTQFLDPKMTEEEEAEYYSGYYKKQKIRHFKTMNLKDLQEKALQHYEQYHSVYIDLVKGKNSILEIGSGTGGFIRFVQKHCPITKIRLIERCDENVKFLRESFGQEVEIVDEFAGLKNKSFDLIAAFGVFEHVRDSRAFLKKIRNYLSPTGKLILNVPNKNHALVYAYELSEFKKFTYMKQHYYTFTEQSFKLLAEQTGYRVGEFNYMQVWGLDNHLSWLRYKKPRNFDDISQLFSQQTLDAYSQDLIDRKLTDLFMVVLIPDDI